MCCATGVQGLAIRIAKAVNRRFERRGRVFADRYHARALRAPREVKSLLGYVRCNRRKHAGTDALPAGFADGCSSARWFDGWDRPRKLVFGAVPDEPECPVVRPSCWLLRTGWRTTGMLEVDRFVDGPSSG